MVRETNEVHCSRAVRAIALASRGDAVLEPSRGATGEHTGAATDGGAGGSRRDHFVLHEDVFYELIAQDSRSLVRWEHGLEDGIAGLGADTPAGRRLTDTLDFFQFMRAELDGMMARWKEHRSRRDRG